MQEMGLMSIFQQAKEPQFGWIKCLISHMKN